MLLPGRGHSWGHPMPPFLPLHSCMGPAAGKRGYQFLTGRTSPRSKCSALLSQPRLPAWASHEPSYKPSTGAGPGQEHTIL